MKNHTELPPKTILLCPVAKGGVSWAHLEIYGDLTISALDRAIEMLVEMRNGWAEEIRAGEKGAGE